MDKINEPYLSTIINEIETLEANPRNQKVEKLVAKVNEYRLKIGKYRILFYIEEAEKAVIIARILHRKEAYR
jgi:mRNA interferase RelE/StbE